MKKLILAAALLVAWSQQPGWAATKAARNCAPPAAAVEADRAIRFMTDLMVASSACRNTVYAEFALRNREAIIHYQKTLIAHMHGAPAFDRWNTSLANEYSQRQAALPMGQFCQQSEPLLKQASALDAKAFRAYAATPPAAPVAPPAKCGK